MDAPLGTYKVEDQVGFLLRKANQRHTAIFADAMAPLDLTPPQFTALVKIVELGQVTQNHLGRLAAMDPATIQGVARRLLDRNLATRSPDPEDRRSTILAPTEAGTDLAAKAVKIAAGITEATMRPLDGDERRQLLALLSKLT
jgi:hypothetical protein